MRAAVLALLVFPALAEPPPLPLPWVKATEIWITPSQSRLYSDNVVYTQTHLPTACLGNCTEGEWYRVDLKPYGVPFDAVGAFLTGMNIITNPHPSEIADVHVTFRKPGDTAASCGKYIGQAVQQGIGGQRSGVSTWVALVNGEFDWCYTTSTAGEYPTHAAYGVNLSVQAWVR